MALAVALAIAMMAAAVVWSLRVILRGTPIASRQGSLATVLLALVAAEAMYLGIVSAARTELATGPSGALLEYFDAGRFQHPFWVMILWPFVAAVALTIARPWVRPWLLRMAALVAIVALLVGSARLGSFDFDRFFTAAARFRAAVIGCLQANLATGDRLICQPGTPWDLTDAVVRAMQDKVSFTRYLNLAPADPTWPMLYDLNDAGSLSSPSGPIEKTPEGYRVAGPAPAAVHVAMGRPTELSHCLILEVKVVAAGSTGPPSLLRWSSADGVRVDAPADGYALSPGAPSTRWFFPASPVGFADRLIVTLSSPDSLLSDVEVRCRMSDADIGPDTASR